MPDIQPTQEKTLRDIIAPSGFEVNPTYIKIGDKFARTMFVFAYPRYLNSGWFDAIINLPEIVDISMFIYPIDVALALRNLRKKVAQVEAQLMERQEKGLVRDPMLETAFQDIEDLRDKLQQAREKTFSLGVYITIYADSLRELDRLAERVSFIFESKLVYTKSATFQQIEGFVSSLPILQDRISVHTPLNTSPISSIFPFSSMDLTSDNGILYGINRHNNSLIIFDRFSLENANLVTFARSGSGKSYAMKLEILRSLMMGINVLVIDPENEYKPLADAVGGSYFKISLTSENQINPFEIPIIPEGEDPADVLKSHVLNLTGLVKLMVGEITPEEDALLDKAITETYASRDITAERKDFSEIEPPLLSDLQTVLASMEGGKKIAQRLEKYTSGSYAGFTNKPTNVDIKNRLIVFSLRDLEEELRPVAMYIILNFIWNLVRGELKKRMLIIDEAWWMMKYQESAAFLFGLVKRARKYYLGVSTITQDVEDFINSPYGRPIVTNSALQLLLKQSPATIDVVAKTFNLSESEKGLLLEAGVGEGLFFAGLKHVAIQVIASYFEDKIVTTDPEQLLAEKEAQEI